MVQLCLNKLCREPRAWVVDEWALNLETADAVDVVVGTKAGTGRRNFGPCLTNQNCRGWGLLIGRLPQQAGTAPRS